MPRFYCSVPLATGDVMDLPAGAARHVQVLRLQPGDTLTLFNGGVGGAEGLAGVEATPPETHVLGGEFEATVVRMGRSSVSVQVGVHDPVEREAHRAVHLVLGMPANERMDWLVEKATELGVVSIQPLVTERTVLRLAAERADKKQAHWQSIAIAACEQSGRNRVPLIHPVRTFALWAKLSVDGPLDGHRPGPAFRPGFSQGFLLSLRATSQPLRQVMALSESTLGEITFLSGPEGGLSDGEEQAALSSGFVGVSLGTRVLRAETAALAALTLMA